MSIWVMMTISVPWSSAGKTKKADRAALRHRWYPSDPGGAAGSGRRVRR
jgi:hypothetical protein